MAGDGRETCQNDDNASYAVLQDDCVKVYKINGKLFGAAHSSEDIERLYRRLMKVKAKKKKVHIKCEDIFAMLVDKKGRIWVYEGRIWQRMPKPYFSVGSGSVFALAAMDAGATAEEAVKIAKGRDPFSGGLVTTVKL